MNGLILELARKTPDCREKRDLSYNF